MAGLPNHFNRARERITAPAGRLEVLDGAFGSYVRVRASGEHREHHARGMVCRLRSRRTVGDDFLEEGAYTKVEILSLSERDAVPESTFDPTRLGK